MAWRSLTGPVESVPLDVFLALAASAQTYRTHFQQPTDPVDPIRKPTHPRTSRRSRSTRLAGRLRWLLPNPAMRSLRHCLSSLLLLVPLAASANSPLDGRWRLDPARSSPLDGWTAWDLVIHVDGTRVSLQHDLQWRTTKHSATNTVDTARPVTLENFFRVEQRHMALYPAKGGATPVRAAWLDHERTLRVEADTPIEISQGQATMRLYSEYRVIEGDSALVLIELHSSRPQPLVYRFTKVSGTK